MLEYESLYIADLTKFGMQHIAQIKALDDEITIQTTFFLLEAQKWCCTIYAIVFGDAVERIGSSKKSLRTRWKETDRILSHKFRDPLYDGASDRELPIWQECFKRHGTDEIYATIGSTVLTAFGPCNIYLAIENMLLQKYKPG